MKNLMLLAVSLFLHTTLSVKAEVIQVAGASFPYPLYSQWISEFQKTNSNIKLDYRAIGSGGGIRQLITGTIDFAGSDAPLNTKEKKKLKTKVLQIPMTIGAVVLAYNLKGVKEINLSPEVITDIYLGKIKKWSHKKIVKLNPKVDLPDQAIAVVRRADGSGTTAIFTEFLASANAKWKEQVGVGKAVK